MPEPPRRHGPGHPTEAPNRAVPTIAARAANPEAAQRLRLAELVRASRSTVALTGAGISVPSGIPDFRSPGTGLWENVNPMQVAHIDAFRSDPVRFWSFYGERFTTLQSKVPNAAHRALAAMEAAGVLDGVITQNVDMLHRRAGTRELIEVHGSIATCSCPRCGATASLVSLGVKELPGEDGKRFEEAKKQFRARADANSDDAEQELGAGKFYYLTGDMDRAVRSFLIGMRIDPDAPAQYMLAAAYVQKGELLKAREVLLTIPAGNSQYPKAQRLLKALADQAQLH